MVSLRKVNLGHLWWCERCYRVTGILYEKLEHLIILRLPSIKNELHRNSVIFELVCKGRPTWRVTKGISMSDMRMIN